MYFSMVWLHHRFLRLPLRLCCAGTAKVALSLSVVPGPRVFVSERDSGGRGVCRVRVRASAWMSTSRGEQFSMGGD